MRIPHVVEKILPTPTITTAFHGLISIFVSIVFYHALRDEQCTVVPGTPGALRDAPLFVGCL